MLGYYQCRTYTKFYVSSSPGSCQSYAIPLICNFGFGTNTDDDYLNTVPLILLLTLGHCTEAVTLDLVFNITRAELFLKTLAWDIASEAQEHVQLAEGYLSKDQRALAAHDISNSTPILSKLF